MSIIKLAVKPIEDKLDNVSTKLLQMESQIIKNKTSIAQLNDNYDELNNRTSELEKDVKTIKEVIVQQQVYLERCKSKDTERNLIITGIPNDGVLINGFTQTNDNLIALAITQFIGLMNITANDFEIFVPPKYENRDTYSIKLNMKDTSLAKNIIA